VVCVKRNAKEIYVWRERVYRLYAMVGWLL
jgi:hypothetical protein